MKKHKMNILHDCIIERWNEFKLDKGIDVKAGTYYFGVNLDIKTLDVFNVKGWTKQGYPILEKLATRHLLEDGKVEVKKKEV